MTRWWIALAVLAFAAAAPAAAATPKILVLPVDGSADAAIRSKLTLQIARLAHALDGQVSTGDQTFADTAAAVGCDPQATSCRDEVLGTLAVDELVWGTATKDGAQTRLVVRRASKGASARELATTITTSDPPDRVAAEVAPLFAPPPAPVAAPPPAPPPPIVSPRVGGERHRDRNVGIVLTATGGVALAVGLALWSSYASQQDTIDAHATRDRTDFDDLVALEDRASRYAIGGDVLVATGVVAAGFGLYYLLRPDRNDRRGVAIAPVPLAHGAGLALTIAGGL